MKDAFGIDRPDLVEKGWKGEPGDKRNTKYALAYGLNPVLAGVPYTIYRQTKTGRRNRNESIAAKKKSKIHKDMTPTGRRGDKRNTKYVASALGGSIAGSAVGTQIAYKTSGMSRQEMQAKNNEATLRTLFGDEKGAKKIQNSAKMKRFARTRGAASWAGLGAGAVGYGVYRHSKAGKENREDSIRAKKGH